MLIIYAELSYEKLAIINPPTLQWGLEYGS